MNKRTPAGRALPELGEVYRDSAGALTFEVAGETFALISWPLEWRGEAAEDSRLSRAESEVAGLALEGFSNEDIARLRGTSAGTVANQLASVYRKLGVGSRSGLSAWAGKQTGRVGRGHR